MDERQNLGAVDNFALQHLSGFLTAVGTTLTAVVAATGDTFTVMDKVGRVFVVGAWAKLQAAGKFQIYGKREFHDPVNGYNDRIAIGVMDDLIPLGCLPEVIPPDALVPMISGSATAGDIESVGLQLGFLGPQAPTQHNMNIAEFEKRKLGHIVSVEVPITAGTAGGYSGTAAFNVANSLMNLANGEVFALLGIKSTVALCSVGYYGPDTMNLRIGVPGYLADKPRCGRYFLDRAIIMPSLRWIPIINGGNIPQTFAWVVSDENAASPILTFVLQQIKP